MGIFSNENDPHYRKWVNLIPTLFVPGSAQFLSGRRMVGISWFVAIVAVTVIAAWQIVSPTATYDGRTRTFLDVLSYVIWICVLIDAFRQPMPRMGPRGWINYLFVCFLITVVPALAVRELVAEPYRVVSKAMEPTLIGNAEPPGEGTPSGDFVLLDKFSARSRDPERGDVIVFRTDAIADLSGSHRWVMRIVGLPNERVRIDPPYVLINGARLSEPPIFDTISRRVDGYGGYTLTNLPGVEMATPEDEVRLGTDEYFVLGDNAINSVDSRFFGPIRKDSIVGRAVLIYFPPERKGSLLE